jgi:hypothetical protein
MKMKYPLPNENARCLGSNCEKKENCSRYLSIEVDTKDFTCGTWTHWKKEISKRT